MSPSFRRPDSLLSVYDIHPGQPPHTVSNGAQLGRQTLPASLTKRVENPFAFTGIRLRNTEQSFSSLADDVRNVKQSTIGAWDQPRLPWDGRPSMHRRYSSVADNDSADETKLDTSEDEFGYSSESSVFSGTNKSVVSTQTGPSSVQTSNYGVSSQRQKSKASMPLPHVSIDDPHANKIWLKGLAERNVTAAVTSSDEPLPRQVAHLQIILARFSGTTAINYLQIHSRILLGRLEKLGENDTYVHAAISRQSVQYQQDLPKVVHMYLTRAAAFLLAKAKGTSSIKLDNEDDYRKYMADVSPGHGLSGRQAIWGTVNEVRQLEKEILKEVFNHNNQRRVQG